MHEICHRRRGSAAFQSFIALAASVAGRELHPLKMRGFTRCTGIVGMDEASSAERRFEIWVDDGREVPYVPIVLPLGNVSADVQVIDPCGWVARDTFGCRQ
jgi:hypothetical protein